MEPRSSRPHAPVLIVLTGLWLAASIPGSPGRATGAAFDGATIHEGAPGPSFARATIYVPLAATISRLEHETPLRAGVPAGETLPPGLSFRLEGQREPLRITVRHETLFVQTRYQYWVTVRDREHGEFRCGSAADPRTASITCMAVIGWDDDWELDAIVRSFPVMHDRNCVPPGEEEREAGRRGESEREAGEQSREGPGSGERGGEVKLLALVNARVESTLAQPLRRGLRAALREHARLHQRVEAIWGAFQDPFEVGDDWIDYDVQRVVAMPLVFAGDSLRVDLALQMQPVLYTARPEPSHRPLPETRVRLYGDEFQIAFDCGVWLDSLASRVRATCASGFPSVGVTDVVVGGSGGLVTVDLKLGKGSSAPLRFSGRATYDERTHEIQVIDLRDAADGARTVPAGTRGSLRRAIQDVLREDISGQIAHPVGVIGSSMNRPVTGEVRMSGGINQRRLIGLVVEGRALVAHWVAIGQAFLAVQ